MFLISIHFSTFPPPHPPYNPLHPASRFIVYFMIITLNARSHHLLGLIPYPPRVLFPFQLTIASSRLFFMTRGTKTHYLVPASQPPVVRTISVFPDSHSLLSLPAHFPHIPDHNGMHNHPSARPLGSVDFFGLGPTFGGTVD